MSAEVKNEIELKIAQSLPRARLNKLATQSKQMQSPLQQILTCPSCGGALEETSGGGPGCMICLLRAGIGGEEEATDDSTHEALEGDGHFGVYDIGNSSRSGSWFRHLCFSSPRTFWPDSSPSIFRSSVSRLAPARDPRVIRISWQRF
jgi:hypothetical protein